MTSPDHPTAPQGLWLPLITPFRDGALDEASLRRLVRHYAAEPLDGLILAATTGEGLTLDGAETERLVAIVGESLAAADRRLPIWLGLSGSDTRKLVKTLARTAPWGIDGYLIACPYYTRPSQQGLLQHFAALADAAAHPIMIYNIPYRTGVNLHNAALLELAGRANIVGVKDCSADAAQSFELLCRRPPGFAVLTGEDALYYAALAQGADGGIVASAHVETEAFAAVRRRLLSGDQPGALAEWRRLCGVPRLLFAEPSPAPIKHWLWRLGLIDSPEVRLPMTPVTAALAERIDRAIAARQPEEAPVPERDAPLPVTLADLATSAAALLALNNAHARELSWLEPARLRHLVGEAFLARRIGAADAFLLAFDQDAEYDSPNFLWFRDRYRRFVYVDRIATAVAARGRGHARRLYEALFAAAARAGHDRVVCEVNAEPPNPASDAFHAALGFVEVGRAAIHGGTRTVRYFSRLLG